MGGRCAQGARFRVFLERAAGTESIIWFRRRADGTLLLAEWIAGTTVAAGIDWTGYTSLYWRHLPSISIFADARHGLAANRSQIGIVDAAIHTTSIRVRYMSGQTALAS